MTTFELLVTVSLVFLCGYVWTIRGAAAAVFVGMLISTIIVPMRLFGGILTHEGLTGGDLRLYTYTAVVSISLVCILFKSPALLGWYPNIFAALCIIWLLLFWTASSNVVAGVVHYILAAYVWVVAAFCAQNNPEKRAILCASTVGAILSLEFIVCILQYLGASLPYFGAAAQTGDLLRVTGTFSHPGNLGKALFLLAILCLPLTVAGNRVVRRISWGNIILVVVLTGLTLGRANLISLASLLALWILFDRQKMAGAKLRNASLLALLMLPFLAPIVARFDADPNGGPRPELKTEALEQFWMTPIGGTGPNNYVETVGLFGNATAQGFPVHNAVYLVVIELGLVVGGLFLWPFVRILASAVADIDFRSLSISNPYSRVLILASPGILITAVTGWGLVSGEILFLMIFVLGYSSVSGFHWRSDTTATSSCNTTRALWLR